MALPNIDINAGTAPLLWSNVHEAFEKINENFTALDLATGGTAVDLSNLFTDIIPADTQTYQLGDQTHRWKSVHTGTWSEVPGSELNGLWAGASQIKGYVDSQLRNIIELPEGSTVAGNLIIDPDKTFFKAAQVDSDLRIEANEFSDTLNLLSGTAIQLVVDSSNESIEINNTGVTAATAGLGINVSSSTGAITITNSGVRSLQSTTALPSGRTTGAGINITASNGDNIRITNTGVLEVQEGFGINVSTDLITGIATVSFDPSAAPQTAFTTIRIEGDLISNNIQSDTTADTLTFAQGYGISLTNNPITDTMTVAVNNRIDIIGSVFGDDSSLLVDGLNGILPAAKVAGTFVTIDTNDKVKINGNLTVLNNLIGSTQASIVNLNGQIASLSSILFAPPYGGNPLPGPNPAIQSQINQLNIQLGQATSTLSLYFTYLSDPNGEISYNAETAQIRMDKTLSVPNIIGSLVGDVRGSVFADDSTILVDSVSGVLRGTLVGNVTGNVSGTAGIATTVTLIATESTAATHYITFVDATTGNENVRTDSSLTYNPSTNTLTTTNFVGTITGNVFTNLIDSADSSAITVTPAAIFSSDVTVENDLSVTQRFLLRGSRVLNLTDLKAVVAASTSFSDFQARIAALV